MATRLARCLPTESPRGTDVAIYYSGSPAGVRKADMPEGAGRRVSVLLVDDNGDQRDLYELLLASEFDVATASRGLEAIDLAAARHPDVIVVDIDMPGMNGFETCRRLKASPSTQDIPVVMLTGRDYIPDEARLAGAFAVLEKPCPEPRLVDTILAAIGGVTG